MSMAYVFTNEVNICPRQSENNRMMAKKPRAYGLYIIAQRQTYLRLHGCLVCGICSYNLHYVRHIVTASL